MNKKRRPIMRVPDPFDGSAQTRLARMGILRSDGQLDQESMCVFADIFTGLFFDDLCDFYDDAKDLRAIYDAFYELSAKPDTQHMHLFISIQYDCIRKPLPDPIWWLAGDNRAMREFLSLFMERYTRFMQEGGFITTLAKEAESQ